MYKRCKIILFLTLSSVASTTYAMEKSVSNSDNPTVPISPRFSSQPVPQFDVAPVEEYPCAPGADADSKYIFARAATDSNQRAFESVRVPEVHIDDTIHTMRENAQNLARVCTGLSLTDQDNGMLESSAKTKPIAAAPNDFEIFPRDYAPAEFTDADHKYAAAAVSESDQKANAATACNGMESEMVRTAAVNVVRNVLTEGYAFNRPFSQSTTELIRESQSAATAANGVSAQNAQCPAACFTSPLDEALVNKILKDCNVVGDMVEMMKVAPLEHPFRPKKMLFVGPPGTGKTTLAQAVAQSCGMEYHMYKASDIAGTYKNDGSGGLRSIFKEHASSGKLCVIAIDEFQVLIEKYQNKIDHDKGMLVTLWSLLEEYKNSKITFIGMLNYVNEVPKQIEDRFEHVVRISLPSGIQRAMTIEFYCTQNNHAQFKDIDFQVLAQKTDGFSNRKLHDLVGRAAYIAGIRTVKANNPKNQDAFCALLPQVTMADFCQALESALDDPQKYIGDDETYFAKVSRKAWDAGVWAGPRIVEAFIQAFAHALMNVASNRMQDWYYGNNPRENMQMVRDDHTMRREAHVMYKDGHTLSTQVQELSIRAMANPDNSKALATALLVKRGMVEKASDICAIL